MKFGSLMTEAHLKGLIFTIIGIMVVFKLLVAMLPAVFTSLICFGSMNDFFFSDWFTDSSSIGIIIASSVVLIVVIIIIFKLTDIGGKGK